MEQQASQVVPAGPHAVELAIEHVRHHGDRVPIACHLTAPDPRHAFLGQAGLDMRICGDVVRVVVVNKPMPRDRPIDRQRAQSE